MHVETRVFRILGPVEEVCQVRPPPLGGSARSATKSQEQVCFFRIELPDVATKNCPLARKECPPHPQLFFPNQCSAAVPPWPYISWNPTRRSSPPLRGQRWHHAKKRRWGRAKPSASKFQNMVCTLTYCKRPLVQHVWFSGNVLWFNIVFGFSMGPTE